MKAAWPAIANAWWISESENVKIMWRLREDYVNIMWRLWSALKTHWKCIESALKVHWKAIRNAMPQTVWKDSSHHLLRDPPAQTHLTRLASRHVWFLEQLVESTVNVFVLCVVPCFILVSTSWGCLFNSPWKLLKDSSTNCHNYTCCLRAMPWCAI